MTTEILAPEDIFSSAELQNLEGIEPPYDIEEVPVEAMDADSEYLPTLRSDPSRLNVVVEYATGEQKDLLTNIIRSLEDLARVPVEVFLLIAEPATEYLRDVYGIVMTAADLLYTIIDGIHEFAVKIYEQVKKLADIHRKATEIIDNIKRSSKVIAFIFNIVGLLISFFGFFF